MSSNGNDKNVLGDPEDIYFGKEAVYRQDSKGYALPDDVEDQDGKQVYSDDTRNVRIPNLQAEDLNDIYFGKEDIYRQDSKGYTLPDDEDGEKLISTKHTTKDNAIDVLFDNDTSKLEENKEGYLLPTGNEETEQVKHKHMERELKKYEIVEYENVTSINVMKLATEDKTTKEVEAKNPVEEEALYVNSKVDPDLWRPTAHKYF
ncbi:uncharacterized protein [Antedon mediterranea]|uniref:uncharacterized protein n=1 Tax=Antedon mediterranea TaxID=105859 RepID=UPI003AF8A8CE